MILFDRIYSIILCNFQRYFFDNEIHLDNGNKLDDVKLC